MNISLSASGLALCLFSTSLMASSTSFPLYNEARSMAIIAPAHHGKGSFYLQFKYSQKHYRAVSEELDTVHRQLNKAVALHHYQGGYRMLISVTLQEMPNTQAELARLGYPNTVAKVLNSEPMIAESPVVAKPPKNVFTTLGHINKRSLFMVTDKIGDLNKVTYKDSVATCEQLGDSAHIASREEYIALLSSTAFINEYGTFLGTPFWYQADQVITRFAKEVALKPARQNIRYHVICSAPEL
ncbi:exported hypothetical protein [Vibrio coralliirubri]|nr:exported hypothetical protein [Vibrio coralliirubri]